MQLSRIPDFSNKTREGMSLWFAEMTARELLFHPEDRPCDVFRIVTGAKMFTKEECSRLNGILSEMFCRFGDGVCETAYPIFMKAVGFPLGD